MSLTLWSALMLWNSCDFIDPVSSYSIYYVRKGELEFSFYPQEWMETVKSASKVGFICSVLVTLGQLCLFPGNKYLNQLTVTRECKLRIDMVNVDDISRLICTLRHIFNWWREQRVYAKCRRVHWYCRSVYMPHICHVNIGRLHLELKHSRVDVPLNCTYFP